MTDQLIIGAGEVGWALSQHLACDVRDVSESGGLLDRYEILHICYPWQIPQFVGTTHEYVKQYRPDYVVVHSTVPVGTCDYNGWVHSPVRGRHPNLLNGLRAFTKHFGGPDAMMASLSWPGGDVLLHPQAATTEAAKLFELAMFGVEVMMEKEIHEFCEANELPFEEVYTEFAGSYNRGWAALGEPRFTKPVLKHMPGSVGGHCVIAGAEMLPRKGFVEYLLQQDNVR